MKTYLAPMAGYTDRAFRDLCRKEGADVVFAEMVNARQVLAVPDKGKELLQITAEEKPVAVQLFGHDPEALKEASHLLEEWNVDYIDLNCGCPARKVVKTGAGSALLKDLSLLTRIIRVMRASVKRACLSIKIRAGWDSESLVFQEAGKIAQEEGADLLFFHARTRSQGFGGKAHWPWIGELAGRLSLPVVGNGDIRTWQEAALRLEETSCAGIMIGRGAIGRPRLFREIKEGRTYQAPREDILNHLYEHYCDKARWAGEHKAVLQMRKVAPFYVRGFPDAKEIRILLNKAASLEEARKGMGL
ncbi:MAG TPA: tRNA-dihydrouridine synthase family protein [Firmicutes bacterium]|nr:tRNA-dihydrouridine synthase family protein [Bacillota bacterium]